MTGAQSSEPDTSIATGNAPASPRSGAKGVAKRVLAPFERRIEFIVAQAVDQAMQQESRAIQEALRADVATMVELTYELQRTVDQLRAQLALGDSATQS